VSGQSVSLLSEPPPPLQIEVKQFTVCLWTLSLPMGNLMVMASKSQVLGIIVDGIWLASTLSDPATFLKNSACQK
jgi:hypothetical protein